MRGYRDEDDHREDDGGSEPAYLGQARVLHVTENALLCLLKDRKYWIPIRVLHDDSEVHQKGDEGRLEVQSWWEDLLPEFEAEERETGMRQEDKSRDSTMKKKRIRW